MGKGNYVNGNLTGAALLGNQVAIWIFNPRASALIPFPLNMPHKEKGSDKMARRAQARICILMCLSESLWIRAGSASDHATPWVGTKQPIIAATQKTTSCVRGSRCEIEKGRNQCCWGSRISLDPPGGPGGKIGRNIFLDSSLLETSPFQTPEN